MKARSSEPDNLIPLSEKYSTYFYLAQMEEGYFEYKPIGVDEQVTKIRFETQFTSGFAAVSADRDLQKIRKFQPEHDYVRSLPTLFE